MNKKELIEALKELHRKQRTWHRLVMDEELNMEVLEAMSIEELQAVYDAVSKN